MVKANIYCAYSSINRYFFYRLGIHLYILTYLGLANIWHRHKIDAGSEWASEIDAHLEAADIILLLISADFLASGYCDGNEMTKAFQRHEQGKARVIPIGGFCISPRNGVLVSGGYAKTPCMGTRPEKGVTYQPLRREANIPVR
jgi:hypothetical protein